MAPTIFEKYYPTPGIRARS